MNVSEQDNTTPIGQIDEIMAMFRIALMEYAMDFVVTFLLDNWEYNQAVEQYMNKIRDSDDWNMWRQHLRGIVIDCERFYGMEKWWVRSCMNFDLEKEVRRGFKCAWERIN